MAEPRFLQLLNNAIDLRGIDGSVSKTVAAADNVVARDLDERDGLGVTGLEADGCAGGDVETEAVGAGAVEGEEGVGFDEVVVGADLACETSQLVACLRNPGILFLVMTGWALSSMGAASEN